MKRWILFGGLALAFGFDFAIAQEDKSAPPKPKPALPISAEAPAEQLVAAITKALEEGTIRKGVTTPELLKGLFPGGRVHPSSVEGNPRLEFSIFLGAAWPNPPEPVIMAPNPPGPPVQVDMPYFPWRPRWRVVADFAGTPATLVRFSLQFLEGKTDLMPKEPFYTPY